MNFDATLNSFIYFTTYIILSVQSCLFIYPSTDAVPAATTATTTLILFFRPWHTQHDFLLSRDLRKTCCSLFVTFFFVLMIGILFISRRIIAYCERCVLFVVTMILFCNFWQKYCTRVIGYFQWNHNGNRRDVE